MIPLMIMKIYMINLRLWANVDNELVYKITSDIWLYTMKLLSSRQIIGTLIGHITLEL
jgi:hypothetical protein